ncbi:hypothetical protein BU17DRAFT_73699 [Hysterangium stoloniferum]|nr:hypothetical protein BU17DRAFT_73699 [Hysterangium stoloniferum]
MKFNTPFPQTLPEECKKATRIFQSFVDNRNQGLDGVIPQAVLEHAKGFAIFSVFKAGFVLSARAGSGIVVAKLPDGTWSAPTAICTAGMGFGSQAGAEVTDFLITLNSRSKSFMAAGSLTLGGNMSIALGPLGRNGEASGSLSTAGGVAAMYSYSKTKGLFGGLSVEGSVIIERQDANALAYDSAVTAKMLLSGVVPSPQWANELNKTLDGCTSPPGARNWIPDTLNAGTPHSYAFEGVAGPSPNSQRVKKAKSVSSFPPASWGKRKDSGSYFGSVSDDDREVPEDTRSAPPLVDYEKSPFQFPAHFEPDVRIDSPASGAKKSPSSLSNPFLEQSHRAQHLPSSKSLSILVPSQTSNPFLRSESDTNPFPAQFQNREDVHYDTKVGIDAQSHNFRAVALYNFKAIEPGDLDFLKGDIITIIERSEKVDDWWTGVVNGKHGIFPANFVKLI